MSGAFAEILSSVKLGEDERARLVGLHARLAPQFPAIAERFYDAVRANPQTAAVLSHPPDPAQGERLRNSLVDWMASGLLGPYDDQFYERRSRIGRRHVTIGLPQHYMFTAMNLIRSEYDDRIATLYEPAEARLVAKAADKLFDLELALMLRHYQLASEVKLVERERRCLAERVTAIQTLSAGLAHEIRNPLNSAKLQLQLLERRLRKLHDDPQLVEPTQLVHHEITRLTHLLNEFLAFARPPELEVDDHDVAEIARAVVEAERVLAEQRGAELVLVPGERAPAHVDSGKLHQIILNLVRNAIEAVERGGHVAVTVGGDHDTVSIAVEDDGHGIPDAIRSRIYEPFFSTKENGTGLGMSIVQSMVTLHRGTLDVRSSPRGTRFDVVMPRR
ncbi:MAG: hybrid sensor histidine kinase/response regulator [Deltaproteobacteria bacterium]|nr:hybrid sensor histidine kinase/response regulator [Deltaproteobacteria bacterium]